MKTETLFKSETLSGSLNFQELNSRRPNLAAPIEKNGKRLFTLKLLSKQLDKLCFFPPDVAEDMYSVH